MCDGVSVQHVFVAVLARVHWSATQERASTASARVRSSLRRSRDAVGGSGRGRMVPGTATRRLERPWTLMDAAGWTLLPRAKNKAII